MTVVMHSVSRLQKLILAGVLCFGAGVFLAAAQTGAPDSAAAQRALALEQQGQWKDAEAAWRQALAANPRDAAASGHLGIVLAREGDYPGAADAYRRALELDPRMTGLQLNLGLALFKQGKLKEAVAPLKAAVAAAPGDAQPRILLAMSYFGSAQYAEAIPYLKYAVEQSPQNEELRGVLAQACLYAKQFTCTLEQYKQIVTANPDSAQAHVLAGEAEDGLHHTPEAIAEFQAAEKVAPHEPNVHFGLGYLLWTQHKYQDAAQEFKTELKGDPSHLQALAYLGDTEMKLEETAQAQATLEKAVALPGATRLAWLDLGIVLADQGRNDEAETDFKHVIQMDPNQVEGHWRLARLYKAEGKTAEAQAEFAKSSALHEKQDQSLVQQMTPEKQR
jgi:tetratricopeptide (TPR) repeat protein